MRRVGLAVLGVTLGLLVFWQAPSTGAAEPPNVSVGSRDCGNKRIALDFKNPTGQTIQWTLVLHKTTSVDPTQPPTQQDETSGFKQGADAISKSIDATDNVVNKVSLDVWANAVDAAGKKGQELLHKTLNEDPCQGAGLPNPLAAARNWFTDQGMKGVAAWIMNGAQATIGSSKDIINSAPEADPTKAAWFGDQYGHMRTLSLLFLLLLFMAAVIGSVWRRDPAEIGQITLVYLPLAVLGGAVAATFVSKFVAVGDLFAAMMWQGTDARVANYLDSLRAAYDPSALDGNLDGPFAVMLIALASQLMAIVIYVELVLRSIGLALVTVFLPLSFAGLVWIRTRIWLVRGAQLAAALILSKFMIFALIALGVAAITGTGKYTPKVTDWGSLVVGGVMLFVGGLAPFALVKYLPLAGLAAEHALGGAGGAAVTRRAQQYGTAALYKGATAARQVGGVSGMAAAGVGAAAGGVTGASWLVRSGSGLARTGYRQFAGGAAATGAGAGASAASATGAASGAAAAVGLGRNGSGPASATATTSTPAPWSAVNGAVERPAPPSAATAPAKERDVPF